MDSRDNAEYTLDLVNFWINNIDSKSSYAISFAGVLLGFIIIQGLPQSFLRWTSSIEFTFSIFIGAVMVVLLYVFSLASICSFVLALIARINFSKIKRQHLFFSSISTCDLKQFTKEFLCLSNDDYVLELLEQVHINSCICTKKARWYNRGIKELLATVVLCFICKIFQLV